MTYFERLLPVIVDQYGKYVRAEKKEKRMVGMTYGMMLSSKAEDQDNFLNGEKLNVAVQKKDTGCQIHQK